MASSVRVVDRGANAMLKSMAEASKPATVKVGVIGQEASAGHKLSALTMVAIATIHEFGLGPAYKKKGPNRSFIRAYVDEKEATLKKRLRGIGEHVLRGKSVRMGLEQFGLLTVGEIQQRISAGIPPALDQSTIDRKGSSTPLINTGQLRSSITHQVMGGPV